MSGPPDNYYTAAQVRELDRRVIEDHGVDAYQLMRRAGKAAFECLRLQWPRARTLAILAGKGNNGGDGYVIGTLAAQAGMEVTLCTLGDHAGLKGSAKQAAAAYRATGGTLRSFEGGALPGADLYVDAMLGTGLDRALGGVYADAANALNETGKPVFAVDVPTGLNADTGNVQGDCVRADVTATFIGAKLGLYTGAGPDYAGRVVFDTLNAPQSIYDDAAPSARGITAKSIARLLPPRRRTAHKGDFGHVLILGGDAGTGGAACLAGEAALRAGAGLVSTGTRAEHVNALLAQRPELMAHGLDNGEAIKRLLQRASVLAVGPGLGQGDWSKSLWRAALGCGKSLVLDADALNLLAQSNRTLAGDGAILTPHPGEAARLLGTDSAGVQADRPRAALEIARRYGAVTVLKGAGSLVATPGGALWLCPLGNPGMASGGMGDVLTGLIAGLYAQGLEAAEAACAGVYAHAAAADRAAREGERGMIAADVIAKIRRAVNPRD